MDLVSKRDITLLQSICARWCDVHVHDTTLLLYSLNNRYMYMYMYVTLFFDCALYCCIFVHNVFLNYIYKVLSLV